MANIRTSFERVYVPDRAGWREWLAANKQRVARLIRLDE